MTYARIHCEAPLFPLHFFIPLLGALSASSHGVTERAQCSTSELSPSLKALTSRVAPGLHIPTFKMKWIIPPCLLQARSCESVMKRAAQLLCKQTWGPLLAVAQGAYRLSSPHKDGECALFTQTAEEMPFFPL